MRKYIKSFELYESQLNEGLTQRGNYKIEWPLSPDKYAEWTDKEIKDVEKLEYDDGEWGGFSINRNWTDKNPIQNFHDDYLKQSPGNLFYDPTKVGSMTINSYNVTSGDHVVTKLEMRILKVNNGKADGYVMFCEYEIDSGYEKEDNVTITFASWAKVLAALKKCAKTMKTQQYELFNIPSKKSIRFLIGESINEMLEVTKKMWDKDWSLSGRMSAKEYDKRQEKREQALFSIIKDPDDAQEHIQKNWDQLPPEASHMVMYESVNEGRKIRVKRKYTENYPAKEVQRFAPVREMVLRHVSENGGTISKKDLKEFIKGMNEDKGRKTSFNWVRRNSKYLRETRNGYTLTGLGKRVLKATSLNESLVLNEGQFSWMTHDTDKQIGSERENTIWVTMFDDKGNKWQEKGYDGYGEFGGKDYYELLADMNGFKPGDENDPKLKLSYKGTDYRQIGIDLAFGKIKTRHPKKKVLFPALYEDPKNFNKNRHNFTIQAENDPNQSWYQEEEEDYGDHRW